MRASIKLAVPVLAALLLSGCGISLQNSPVGRDVDGPSYQVTAVFTDVSGLPIGGRVRIGPATIGRVESMDAQDYTAHVVMNIRSDVKLPKSTKAGLELSTALGDQFVALKLPKNAGGEMLADGGVIPLENTIRGPDIEDNMAVLSDVLNNSGIEQARTIVTELNTMLEGREDKARALLKRAEAVLASLDNRTDEFNRTLRAVNTLGKTVNDNQDVLAQALTEIRPAIDVLHSQQGNFDTLLDSVKTLSGEVNTAMRKSKTQLVNTLIKIEPVLNELGTIDADLGRMVKALPKFSQLFQRATPGDYVNLKAVANIPDSLAGLLIGGGGTTGGQSRDAEPVSGQPAAERLLRGGAN